MTIDLAFSKYKEGELVAVQGTFKNTAGAVQDPSIVKLTVREPSGTETTYIYGTDAIVTKSSTGVYAANLDTTGKRGLWLYTWWSTGTGQADSGEKGFWVE
jgi:hypothetical protein